MTVKEYLPSFYSGFDKKVTEFFTIEDLLTIDWISCFSKEKDFYRFSICRDKREIDRPQHRLMAEYENGKKWYVIATIPEKDISAIESLIEWQLKQKP